jgi:predicted metal-dependent hydrolase
VQKAMQALREMPPFAREREIDSGRYSHFSQEDKELLRTAN